MNPSILALSPRSQPLYYTISQRKVRRGRTQTYCGYPYSVPNKGFHPLPCILLACMPDILDFFGPEFLTCKDPQQEKRRERKRKKGRKRNGEAEEKGHSWRTRWFFPPISSSKPKKFIPPFVHLFIQMVPAIFKALR